LFWVIYVAEEEFDEKHSHYNNKGNHTKRKNAYLVTKKFSPKFHNMLLFIEFIRKWLFLCGY